MKPAGRRVFRLVGLACGFVLAAGAGRAEPAAPPYAYELRLTRGNVPGLGERLEAQCRRMQADFRTEFARLAELRGRIFRLLHAPEPAAHAAEIHALVGELSKASGHIRELAAPEWNREIWDLNLAWRIGRSELFAGEREYVRRLTEIRNNPRGLTAEKIKFLRAGPPLRVLNLQMDGAWFLGEPNPDIKVYFDEDAANDDRRGIRLTYRKKATALELCQFLPGLQFQVTVNYRVRELGVDIQKQKHFDLGYGENLPVPLPPPRVATPLEEPWKNESYRP